MLRKALAAAVVLVLFPIAAWAADDSKPVPPKSWVDKDTGHRVWRLSDELNSGGFYFNVNGYTPDQKQMIYTAPDGIHGLDMATRKRSCSWRIRPVQESAPQWAARIGSDVHALVAGAKPIACSIPRPIRPRVSLRSTRPSLHRRDSQAYRSAGQTDDCQH